MIRVRRITRDDPLYQHERDLRDDVLLRQVGMDMAAFDRDYGEFERLSEHFVAVADTPASAEGGAPDGRERPATTRVLGCVLLRADYPEPGVGKLMQMAVDPQRQGEGIGKRLVVALEARAFGELGLTRLFCHAREDAIGFYEAIGWRGEGDMFDEVGIPHRKLVLRAPAKPDALPLQPLASPPGV